MQIVYTCFSNLIFCVQIFIIIMLLAKTIIFYYSSTKSEQNKVLKTESSNMFNKLLLVNLG